MEKVVPSTQKPFLHVESISRNTAASRMYSIAEKLQTPLYFLCNTVIGRLKTVLTPGKFGNYTSVKLEIIRRIFLIVISPFAAVGSLVGSLSAIAFNYTGDRILGNQSYLCLKGTYQGPSRNTFTTFNMSTLLPPMTSIDGVAYSNERLQGIAQVIKDFQFVCGQEVDGASARFLSKELREHFVEFSTYFGNSNAPLMPSGLFFASKAKPENITVISFKGSVQKSIKRVAVIIEFPNYCVVNTHLDGGSGEKAAHTHAEEIQQIIKALEPHEKPIVLCGDLNEDRYKPTKAYYLLTEHFVDCIQEQRPHEQVITCTDALEKARFGKKGLPKEESVDYIAYRKNQAGATVEFVRTEDHFYLSDHRLVVGKMLFS